MNKADKRRHLFGLFSHQLQFFHECAPDTFACPLCWRQFGHSHLDLSNPRLTLAHIIPERLGGTLCTLACVDCNNGNGKDLEPSLFEHLKAQDFAAGIGEIDASLKGNFGKLTARFGRPGGGQRFSIFVQPERSDPASVVALGAELDTSKTVGSKLTLNLSFTLPHRPSRTLAAAYQSAYLLMFHSFGYEFVAQSQYHRMRDQIQNPDADIWKTPVVKVTDESAVRLLDGRNQRVLFLDEPPVIVALLRLKTPNESTTTLGVILPGLDELTEPNVPFETFRCSIIEDANGGFANSPTYFRDTWDYCRKTF